MSSLPVQNGRFDVAVVNNEEVLYISWAENQLFILDISASIPSIKQTTELDESYNVRYIAAYKNKIILSCWDTPPSIKLVDRNGKLYWSRSLDDHGTRLLQSPFYSTCFLENNRLSVIVSDADTTKITKLDGETGHVVKLFDLDPQKSYRCLH